MQMFLMRERDRKAMLRGMLASILALSLAAAYVGPVAAETPPKKEKKHARTYSPSTADRYEPPSPRPPPYIERDASKIRFGSTEWWEQMRREGRLGGETP
jgi:hypothetical protein